MVKEHKHCQNACDSKEGSRQRGILVITQTLYRPWWSYSMIQAFLGH